jgi:hypothetical protein
MTVVTLDELFLFTFEDLEGRAQLGAGEYDALNMAWLLRKMLLRGRRSLVEQVVIAGGYTEPSFRVTDTSPPPGILGWHPNPARRPGEARLVGRD